MFIKVAPQMIPPPMVNKVNDNKFEDLVRSDMHVIREFPDYPYHTQIAEHCV